MRVSSLQERIVALEEDKRSLSDRVSMCICMYMCV